MLLLRPKLLIDVHMGGAITTIAAVFCIIYISTPRLPRKRAADHLHDERDRGALSGILAERLLEFVPHLDKVFFSNSGTTSHVLFLSALNRALRTARTSF